MEAGQRDELELVAHRAELALELRDRGVVETAGRNGTRVRHRPPVTSRLARVVPAPASASDASGCSRSSASGPQSPLGSPIEVDGLKIGNRLAIHGTGGQAGSGTSVQAVNQLTLDSAGKNAAGFRVPPEVVDARTPPELSRYLPLAGLVPTSEWV